MSAASDYTENNIANWLLRGEAPPVPAGTYVALHTSDPGESGGANEVQTSAWPAYARQDAADGGVIASGWTEPADGVSENAKQLIFPVYDGTGSITVSHFSVKDAVTGGNTLVKAPLNSSRTLSPGDVFVVDVNRLTVQVL